MPLEPRHFKHQNKYEQIGGEIGHAIDRYIERHYADPTTVSFRDDDVTREAASAERTALTIERAGLISIPQKDWQHNPWIQIIALFDILKREYDAHTVLP